VSGLIGNNGEAYFKPDWATSLALVTPGKSGERLGALAFVLDASTGLSATLTTEGAAFATGVGLVSNYGPKNPVPTSYLNQSRTGIWTKGVYSVALPGKTQHPALDPTLYPQGTGYFSLTLNKDGAVAISGMLPDGTKLAAASRLRTDGTVPLFAPLYGMGGSVGGELTLQTLPDSDISGTDWFWCKPARDRATQYPAGWNGIRFDAVGTKYSRPDSLDFGQGVADFVNGNAKLTLSGGQLVSDVQKTIMVSPDTGAVKAFPPRDPTFKLALTPTNGIFRGRFLHTSGTSANFSGILLDRGTNRGGYGYFLSKPKGTTGESGIVFLDPNGP
jgi:hypothetical protein